MIQHHQLPPDSWMSCDSMQFWLMLPIMVSGHDLVFLPPELWNLLYVHSDFFRCFAITTKEKEIRNSGLSPGGKYNVSSSSSSSSSYT
jgi:hypothetical protein